MEREREGETEIEIDQESQREKKDNNMRTSLYYMHTATFTPSGGGRSWKLLSSSAQLVPSLLRV